MNPVAAIQSQLLQTLLQAIQPAETPLQVGDSIAARFLGWEQAKSGESGVPQGTVAARVQAGSNLLTLLISADAARGAALQPGSVLTLQVEKPAAANEPARMRLVSITPAAAEPQAMVQGQRRPEVVQVVNDLPPRAGRDPGPAESEARLAVRAAAGPVIGAALARQNGLAPLFANLEVLERVRVLLPASVNNAVANALQARLPVPADGRVLPELLQQAVADSGVFHEARLARGDGAAAAFDLKSTLLALRQALRAVATENAAQAAGVLQGRVPVPNRGGMPVPQAQAEPTVDAFAQSPSTMIETVLRDTDAALDRLSIVQFTSLPSPADIQTSQIHTRWFVEVPMAFDGRTVMLPLEIEEDRGGGHGEMAPGRLWRIRFVVDVEPIGPVHAMVTMQGKLIGVHVWAEREATSQLVRSFSRDLEAALLDSDFERADIEVVTGQPARRAPQAGQFLDRRS